MVESHTDTISPKQAARALGVSESSLKRWCDQGLIRTVRTVGGHRKMPTADVLRFAREHDHALISPEVLGLPPVSEHAPLGLARGQGRLVDAFLDGDELLARQIVFDLYLARHAMSEICDAVIAGAFHQIGDRWACQTAEVYQERRACEICARILHEIRKLQNRPTRGGVAIGGTIEGDQYALPSAMAELVLRGAGYEATTLGTSIPVGSLIRAVQETKPKLFWLSVSHIREGLDFVGEFAALSQACAAVGSALVVGGRALGDDLRQRMTYSAYCDTMQQLERFAQTLRPAGRPAKPHGAAAPRAAKRPTATKRKATKTKENRRG